MKVLYLSDDIRLASGYGKIGGAFCRYLRDKGHDVIVMGGSMGQKPFQPINHEGIEIWPVADYGNMEHIRYLIREKKPDVMLLNADPRMFQQTTFMIDNEIRRQCPIVFYHLWDGPPFPMFNTPMYRCCDSIIAASKFTYNMLEENKDAHSLPPIYYAPIGINTDLYKPLSPDETERFRQEFLKAMNNRYDPEFIIGFIGRFIPRKRIWDLMRIFTKFAENKKEKALLLMHTPVQDFGGNLLYVQRQLFPNQPIVISHHQGQPDDVIVRFMNLFDVSINLANAEGFGMPLVESMACGTPVISSACAGPSGYVNDKNGWLLQPKVRSIIGSEVVPYIEDIYVSDEQVLEALEEAYSNKQKYYEKASRCREMVVKNYNEKDMVENVEKALLETVEKFTPVEDYTITSFPAMEGVINE